MDQLHQIIEEKAKQLYTVMNGEFEKDFEKLKTDFQEYKEKHNRLVYNLRFEIATKNDKLLEMECKIDSLEQEKLQNTVRMVNLHEIDDDKDIRDNLTAIATGNLKIKTFNKSDIIKVHRMSKQKSKGPRDLIVTFSNSEIRNKFREVSNNAKLKTEDETPVYVNDNLTLRRSKLFYDCRRWRKAQRGNIIIKVTETSRPIEVTSHDHLRSLININHLIDDECSQVSDPSLDTDEDTD